MHGLCFMRNFMPRDCNKRGYKVVANKVLIKGNLAIAQAAIDAGLECYFAYLITPQNGIGEFMSDKMPSLGNNNINEESKIAALKLILRAFERGTNAMTMSSSGVVASIQEEITVL